MKTLLLVAALLVTGFGAWFTLSDDQAPMPESAPEKSEAPALIVPAADPTPDVLRLAGAQVAQVAQPSRTPVAAESPELSDFTPEVDPCAALREANLDQAAEIAWLNTQISLLQAYEGRTPYDHFLQSQDATAIADPEQKLWLKNLMGTECPFYLQPGEASYLVARRDDPGGYDSFEEMMIRFLGPARVLREAPPEWIERMSKLFLSEEWESIFGTPVPD